MMTPPPRYRKRKSGLGGAGSSGTVQPLPTGACARFPFVDSWTPKLGCKAKTAGCWRCKGPGDKNGQDTECQLIQLSSAVLSSVEATLAPPNLQTTVTSKQDISTRSLLS